MTAEEHKLLVLMFGVQERRFQTLLKILESRGIIDQQDFEAFEFAAGFDASGNYGLASDVAARWGELCSKAGVALPSIPRAEPPKNQ